MALKKNLLEQSHLDTISLNKNIMLQKDVLKAR